MVYMIQPWQVRDMWNRNFWFDIKMGIGCECPMSACILSNGPFWKDFTNPNAYGFIDIQGFCIKCRKSRVVSFEAECVPYYQEVWPQLKRSMHVQACDHTDRYLISPCLVDLSRHSHLEGIEIDPKDMHLCKCSIQSCGATGRILLPKGLF